MKTIVLLNKIDKQHLEDVKKEMQVLGTPTIRGIYDEGQGVWFAVEGSHRLQAAFDLGLMPEMVDVVDEEEITIELDQCDETVNTIEFFFELQSARNPIILRFAESE
jgi:flagellar biosynthesis regulator FlbT